MIFIYRLVLKCYSKNINLVAFDDGAVFNLTLMFSPLVCVCFSPIYVWLFKVHLGLALLFSLLIAWGVNKFLHHYYIKKHEHIISTYHNQYLPPQWLCLFIAITFKVLAVFTMLLSLIIVS